LLDEVLPRVVDTFRIATTKAMGPGVRRDDGGVFVGAFAQFSHSNFKQPSALVLAPPRELGF
jgi:hypothetical protein